jgi:manganese transport protein
VALSLWFLAEVAICACDLAEVIGSAIALHLLFGLPLIWGVCLTSLDVLLLIYLVSHSVRRLEAVVISLVLLIGGCFAVELIFCKPDPAAVARGFIPTAEILHNPQMLYLALGILGATVMPHNLYLHSSLVKTRAFTRDEPGKREAIRFACLDSSLALMFALFINAAILIVAGSVFHERGRTDVTEIAQAHQLLSPMLGTTVAGTVFALALLASGQNSTLTGTLAGQIVMEGFLNIRLAPWVRRLLTRLLAIVPAVIASALYGDAGLSQLLIFSQVVLSLQLSFAVVPLVHFTSSRTFMGGFQAPLWMRVLAVLTALLIIGLNAKYLFDFVTVGETGIGH